MFFISLLFATVLSSQAAELNGWVFHPVNSSNTLFSVKDKGFRGTFVKSSREVDGRDLTLIVSEDRVGQETRDSTDLQAWINTKYFSGKAALLQEVELSKGSKHLFVFQLPENNGLRVVSVYVFMKKESVLLLSAESALDTYKKDLKEIQPFVKHLTF